MDHLIVSEIVPVDSPVEVVERKGLGHPDTICDALAEAFALSVVNTGDASAISCIITSIRPYCGEDEQFQNLGVGKTSVSPINVYLSGRAMSEIGAEHVPIEDIAVGGSRSWLRTNLHALDSERHVRINVLTRPVSQDLQNSICASCSERYPALQRYFGRCLPCSAEST